MAYTITGEKCGTVRLDAEKTGVVVTESVQRSSKVTSNPVEKGSDINDHVINDPVVFSITGVFLDEDQSDILERMWKEKDVVEYTGRTRISDCVITSFKSDISADNKNGSKFTVSLKVINRVSAEYVASGEQMAEELGTSKNQIFRYIRLTNLVPELLDMVDEKKISFNPAVELSYLDTNQQRDFLEAMQDTQNAPSLSQAQRLKKLAQEGHFSYDVAFAVMGEEKKGELDKVVIKNDTLRKYFPRSYTPKQMEDTIIKLLDQWQRKQQRQNEL